MTAVTRPAEAPRAASAISSNSTRLSWTGLTSGWIRLTSPSRQFACNCTCRQSLANRLMRTGLRSTPRWEQISSARLGCALPPKMTISASIALLTVLRRGRRRTAHRRKPQLLPYLLLDGPRGWRRVHGDHALLTAKHVNGRLGLLMEVPQPDGERLLDVIGPAAGHPRADLIVWHVEVNHRVHIVVLHEELRLRDRAREPVDDKPEVPVMLSQPPLDHRLHQVVAYQLAGRQAPPDLGAHLRVVGHLPPE